MADILLSGLTSPLGQNPTIASNLGYSDVGSVPFPIMLGKSGGIGFQLEGGIITVLATNPQVRVSFDRPMVYNGDHTHNPTGPFDIGTPALTPNALAMDIPIVVASPHITSVVGETGDVLINASTALVLDGSVVHVPGGTPYDIGTPVLQNTDQTLKVPITVAPQSLATPSLDLAFPNVIRLAWTENIHIVNRAGWSITSSGNPVNILNLVESGYNFLDVITTEHAAGIAYTLHIPGGYIAGDTGKANSTLSLGYVGIGDPPQVYQVSYRSPTSLLVVYNEDMDVPSATNPANYNIPGLTIYSITKQTNSIFILNTATMVPNTSYTLTITGVKDAAGNVIL